ncbi:hypothetical protein AVEN_137009-1 [Araneus ventricosus]|uniref:Uncharacterized protein n=1 Tax=Araneus ventricosus TaxID=182803 RepID=A0A4Y2R4Q4_ARAVE|nr:hypothetical protein AVEN_137009-1 [Araneus ventricosus]
MTDQDLHPPIGVKSKLCIYARSSNPAGSISDATYFYELGHLMRHQRSLHPSFSIRNQKTLHPRKNFVRFHAPTWIILTGTFIELALDKLIKGLLHPSIFR